MPEVPDATAAALLAQPYGIFLVGSRAGQDRNLMTASWGSQCSFEPRLYTVFVEHDAHTRRLIDAGGAFSVCLVPPDSEEVVSRYTRPAEVAGDKLGDHHFFDAPNTGVPIYDGSVAWFECRVVEARPVGDHIQYTGEVIAGDVRGGDPAWTIQQLGWEYGG